MVNYGQRVLMVIFWIGVIFSLLYVPLITRYFQKPALNVFMWSGVIAPETFKKFEKETGIKINVTYFGGNEELLVKLLATKSKGYDLIMPSDYVIQFLIAHDLLKKLDKNKLRFYSKLNPQFMGHYFDPTNDYSVPFDWYILGLAFNKQKITNPQASWKTIFDPAVMPDTIGLINDPRELIGLAIFYHFGTLRMIKNSELPEIIQILQQQKQRVQAYTDFRGDFLLESGSCPLVLMGSNYIWKEMRFNQDLDFIIPQEGSFLNIENLVLPTGCQKEEQVYQLINFLFEPEIQQYNFEHANLCPTRSDAAYLFETPELKTVTSLIDPKRKQKMQLFYNVLSDEQVNTIWLAVKGS